MKDRESIYEIIHTNVLQIADQVAGISLSQSPPIEMQGPWTLQLSAKGTYHLDLFLQADQNTLRQIAANMKKSPPAEEEIVMYTMEFFNILGGRIVSRINRLFQQSARFAPPVFSREEVEIGDTDNGEKNTLTLFYCYLDGNVKIAGQFVQNEDLKMFSWGE